MSVPRHWGEPRIPPRPPLDRTGSSFTRLELLQHSLTEHETIKTRNAQSCLHYRFMPTSAKRDGDEDHAAGWK